MKTHILKQILLGITALIAVSCTKYTSDNEIIYYDVYGEGYVYYRDTNIPIEGIEILVEPDIDWQMGGGLMSPTNPVETLKTDANGYYRVHFIKKIYGKYPVKYMFSVGRHTLPSLPYGSYWSYTGGIPDNELSVEFVDNAKQTIKFDTMKMYPNKIY